MTLSLHSHPPVSAQVASSSIVRAQSLTTVHSVLLDGISTSGTSIYSSRLAERNDLHMPKQFLLSSQALESAKHVLLPLPARAGCMVCARKNAYYHFLSTETCIDIYQYFGMTKVHNVMGCSPHVN